MRSYYEKELIPQYIGIGGTYEDFWHLNPRKLAVIYDGYRERMKHKADEMYEEARYAFYAHTVALANFSLGFSKSHKKPLKFEEAVEHPSAVKEVIPKNASDRKTLTEAFFMNLKIRQANFELIHGGKK